MLIHIKWPRGTAAVDVDADDTADGVRAKIAEAVGPGGYEVYVGGEVAEGEDWVRGLSEGDVVEVRARTRSEEDCARLEKVLHKLNKSDLSELMGMVKPPARLDKVMRAVCGVCGRANDTWQACLRFLLSPSVLCDLRGLEALTPAQVEVARACVADDECSLDAIARVSLAGYVLREWLGVLWEIERKAHGLSL